MNYKLTPFTIAKMIYWFNAIVMIVVGAAFVFAQEFFQFHGDVIGKTWSKLDNQAKPLYLGMMRTEGAGYLAAATAMIFLLLFPLRTNAPGWAIWAITSVGVIEHVPTLLATYHVSQITEASPPWEVTLALIISLGLAAVVISLRSASDPRLINEDTRE